MTVISLEFPATVLAKALAVYSAYGSRPPGKGIEMLRSPPNEAVSTSAKVMVFVERSKQVTVIT
jgi:hypothetical protein